MPISDMEIFGIETKENQHTAFLSWFLDPEQNMGLGLEPLCRLLNLWEPRPKGGTPNPEGEWTTDLLNALTIEIETEPTESKGSRLDLLIKGKNENNADDSFCLILEAKVESNEHPNDAGVFQTVRYFNDAKTNYNKWGHKIFYFLTLPSGKFYRPPICKAFKHVTYQDILDIIQTTFKDKNIHSNARERLEQYLLCWKNFPKKNKKGATQILPNGGV